VSALPAPSRLALEMALHEEAERRAIQGELAVLEAAWQEAEVIAKIADKLLVPEEVEAQLAALKAPASPRRGES
jgi:Flp pilus assembly protein TadD